MTNCFLLFSHLYLTSPEFSCNYPQRLCIRFHLPIMLEMRDPTDAGNANKGTLGEQEDRLPGSSFLHTIKGYHLTSQLGSPCQSDYKTPSTLTPHHQILESPEQPPLGSAPRYAGHANERQMGPPPPLRLLPPRRRGALRRLYIPSRQSRRQYEIRMPRPTHGPRIG